MSHSLGEECSQQDLTDEYAGDPLPEYYQHRMLQVRAAKKKTTVKKGPVSTLNSLSP